MKKPTNRAEAKSEVKWAEWWMAQTIDMRKSAAVKLKAARAVLATFPK